MNKIFLIIGLFLSFYSKSIACENNYIEINITNYDLIKRIQIEKEFFLLKEKNNKLLKELDKKVINIIFL